MGWSGEEVDVTQVVSGRFVNANVAIRLREATYALQRKVRPFLEF